MYKSTKRVENGKRLFFFPSNQRNFDRKSSVEKTGLRKKLDRNPPHFRYITEQRQALERVDRTTRGTRECRNREDPYIRVYVCTRGWVENAFVRCNVADDAPTRANLTVQGPVGTFFRC